METQKITFGKPDGKKHSVRYFAEGEDAAIESIYVRRGQLGTPIPEKLQVTIKEVE
jgi:hypothetical protein